MDNNQENQNPEQENQTGELNGQQALNVLIQAVRIAQGKGAYTIEDAEIISQAIKIFVPPTPENTDGESVADPVVNDEQAEVQPAEVQPAEPVVMKFEK